jgi:hypothetical protein
VFGAPQAGGAVTDFIKKSHNLKTPKPARQQPAARRKMVKDNPPPQIKVTRVPPQGLVVPTVTARRQDGMPPPAITVSRPEPQRLAGTVPLSYSSDFSTGADNYFDSHAEFYPPETEQVYTIDLFYRYYL